MNTDRINVCKKCSGKVSLRNLSVDGQYDTKEDSVGAGFGVVYCKRLLNVSVYFFSLNQLIFTCVSFHVTGWLP